MRKRPLILAQDEEPLLNLTPLIDVVFVVLILFILVAPMLNVDKVELASTGTEKPSVCSNANLSLYVRADNTVWDDKLQIPMSELVSYLKKIKQKHPSDPLQLFHDKKATFGTYQQVKNAAELAGFDQLDVILQPG